MFHNLDYRCPIRAYRSSFYLCICAVALFTRINFHIHNYKLFCSINLLFFLHPFPNPPIHSFRQFSKQTSRSCPDTSALRAFLRRGIYHSHILEIRSFESMPALRAFGRVDLPIVAAFRRAGTPGQGYRGSQHRTARHDRPNDPQEIPPGQRPTGFVILLFVVHSNFSYIYSCLIYLLRYNKRFTENLKIPPRALRPIPYKLEIPFPASEFYFRVSRKCLSRV